MQAYASEVSWIMRIYDRNNSDPDVWERVMLTQYEAYSRLWQQGASPPERVVAECNRLLTHPRGCPAGLKAPLERLRTEAQRQINETPVEAGPL